MISVKKILLSTDFSDEAAKALPYAVSMAKEYGATLHVVHVVEDSLYYTDFVYEGAPFDPTALIEGMIADRRKRLSSFVEGIPAAVKVETHLRKGGIADEIVECAKNVDADLLVISTHGRSGLKHLLFGSVAEKVLRTSPCPVLVVREKMEQKHLLG